MKETGIITRHLAKFEKKKKKTEHFFKCFEYMILRTESSVDNQYKLLNTIKPVTHN